MFTLRTLRRLPQRRPALVRGVLLLLAVAVMLAGMPKWIMHGHDRAHTATHAIAVDGVASHHHDDDGIEPIVPLPDGSHVHAHYLAGASATLPETTLAVCAPVAPANAGLPRLDAHAPAGTLALLHRPPIV